MNSLSEFRAELEKASADYLMVEPLQPERAHFRFIGFFECQEVIWDTELILPGNQNGSHQSIEVSEENNGEIPLKIVLALPRVTRPDILKTIMMIRNYKNLRVGKHEWSTP